jgi:hypothetical protein
MRQLRRKGVAEKKGAVPMVSHRRIAGILVGCLAMVPLVALAAHGKAGLWESTVTMNMAGMPQMPQMSPEQMAQMNAMGVHMPTAHTVTTQHCMTPQEVAQDTPPTPRSAKECAVSQVKITGHTYSADMTCSGEMEGQGHVSVTYDSDEHYAGTWTFNGAAHGHPVNMTNTFEGKWLSADCGGVK